MGPQEFMLENQRFSAPQELRSNPKEPNKSYLSLRDNLT